MRIISGKFKGKRFYPPANIPARPTTDFAKEALFNILNNRIDYEETKFLDLSIWKCFLVDVQQLHQLI